MTVATTSGGGQPGSALERAGSEGGSSLADVVETVLDKGVVIDAQVTVGVVGIPLLEINARVVVSSIETYLRFADMTDRLDISPKEGGGLTGLVGDVTGAARQVTSGLGGVVGETGAAARELGGTATELGRTAGGAVDEVTRAGRDRLRRRRDEER
ncbi:gas vesicle protein GvpJ [Micromonospora coxensis]|uniref:gas vesicle protein GvpJ n=1 Tax=Micromonospora coxensis TaxID=356852 RepID=UPI003F5655DB